MYGSNKDTKINTFVYTHTHLNNMSYFLYQWLCNSNDLLFCCGLCYVSQSSPNLACVSKFLYLQSLPSRLSRIELQYHNGATSCSKIHQWTWQNFLFERNTVCAKGDLYKLYQFHGLPMESQSALKCPKNNSIRINVCIWVRDIIKSAYCTIILCYILMKRTRIMPRFAKGIATGRMPNTHQETLSEECLWYYTFKYHATTDRQRPE